MESQRGFRKTDSCLWDESLLPKSQEGVAPQFLIQPKSSCLDEIGQPTVDSPQHTFLASLKAISPSPRGFNRYILVKLSFSFM